MTNNKKIKKTKRRILQNNQPLQNNDTSTEETLKRGEAAINARLAVDPRPEEIKQQEEKKDAEKWRNEG